tara:strand:- start:6 stop:323 length:318 start_codon:yes stop_codon:yes gene_type:complete
MKVAISYAVELEEIPSEVQNLIRDVEYDLQKALDNLTIVVEAGRYSNACDNILYIRKKLHKVDTRLEDCYTILNGFERVQKKIEEERDAQQAPLGVERVQDGSND